MTPAISQLEQNLARARSLGGLFEALDRLTTPAIEASDILRSQIVMAVSALDHFVHEVTLAGMLEIYEGRRDPTQAYQMFNIPLEAALSGIKAHGSTWFESIVREKHSILSFQHPERIADAIRLISPISLWTEIASCMNTASQDLKIRLKLIVDRRNKIAHEADLDPTFPGLRWPISAEDACGVVDFIDQISHQINTLVSLD